MKKEPIAENNRRNSRQKLTYVKSASEIPDFKSDDEIADWYETHSTVLIQDQLETLPAKIGGKLRSRLIGRRTRNSHACKRRQRSRSAS